MVRKNEIVVSPSIYYYGAFKSSNSSHGNENENVTREMVTILSLLLLPCILIVDRARCKDW